MNDPDPYAGTLTIRSHDFRLIPELMGDGRAIVRVALPGCVARYLARPMQLVPPAGGLRIYIDKSVPTDAEALGKWLDKLFETGAISSAVMDDEILTGLNESSIVQAVARCGI